MGVGVGTGVAVDVGVGAVPGGASRNSRSRVFTAMAPVKTSVVTEGTSTNPKMA